MEKKFWGLFYFAIIITLFVPFTAKAEILPRAVIHAYSSYGKENPAYDYDRFGTWNDFKMSKFECVWEEPNWNCYGKDEVYSTIVIKPGIVPSIKLSYDEYYTSKDSPDQILGSQEHESYASVLYYWQLREIHPRAPGDIQIIIMFKYKVELSVNMPTEPSWSHYYAKAYLRINNDQFYLQYEVAPLDPKPKSDKGIFVGYYYPHQYYEVNMLARLYSHPDGYATSKKIASGMVYIDPEIIIDPDQMINIDGKDYPANQLYEVELSENLFDSNPKAMPWIPLLLLDE